MILLVCSFLTAFLVTLLAVRSAASHAHLSGDTDKNQPQKFHAQVVPRIGGVGIVMGVVAGGALAVHRGLAGWEMLLALGSCGMIAFAAGLIEDFTKKVTPKQRLLATLAAAAMAVWVVDAVILRTGIPGLDSLPHL